MSSNTALATKGFVPDAIIRGIDLALEPHFVAILQFEEEAKAIEVKDDVTNGRALYLLTSLAPLKKEIEASRVSAVKPFNDLVTTINGKVKAYSTMINVAEDTLKGKSIVYTEEKERIRKAEEDRLRKIQQEEEARIRKQQEEERLAHEKALREAEAANKPAPPPPPPVVMAPPPPVVAFAPPPKTQHTATGGSATMKMEWTFEVTDLKLVPDEYKIVDEVKIGKLVKAGLRQIPGVRIYQKTNLLIRG